MQKQPTSIICLSPYTGGMELDAIKTAKHLSTLTKITLIVKKNSFLEQKAKELKNSSIQIETIDFKKSISFSIIFKAREIIRQNNIKNVIFFGASELKSLYFSFLGLDVNLCVRHGTTKSTPKKDIFHKLIYSDVNWHIANSRHILNNVKHIIPYGKNTKDIVIYPSFEFTEPKHIPQKKLTLLHVGRIAEGKGQIDAIQACEILVKNDIDFEFKIVGGFDEKYRQTFENFLKQCPYKEKIDLVGFTDKVETYYNEADIFLFPSHGEGLSNAFIEALAHNVVSICYNNTSFTELKELGFYFHMCSNLDTKALASKLFAVINKLEEEKKLSMTNFEKANKIFSIENELKRYEGILYETYRGNRLLQS